MIGLHCFMQALPDLDVDAVGRLVVSFLFHRAALAGVLFVVFTIPFAAIPLTGVSRAVYGRIASVNLGILSFLTAVTVVALNWHCVCDCDCLH